MVFDLFQLQLFLLSYYFMQSVFKNYDHDQDGYISQEEFEKIAASFPFSFCIMDKDRYLLIMYSWLSFYGYHYSKKVLDLCDIELYILILPPCSYHLWSLKFGSHWGWDHSLSFWPVDKPCPLLSLCDCWMMLVKSLLIMHGFK